MRTIATFVLLLAIGGSVTTSGVVTRSHAKEPAKQIFTISIEGMHCAGCAKAVTKRLAAVEHVATVKVDVRSATATGTPNTDREPSVRLLWEAIEKAGYKPTKIVTPSQTITVKPKA